MNSVRKSFQLAQVCARQVATSGPKSVAVDSNVPAGYSKIKAKQAKFQVKDGQPIFLKGGAMDKIMYQGTMGISLVGVFMVLKMIFDLSMPATPSE